MHGSHPNIIQSFQRPNRTGLTLHGTLLKAKKATGRPSRTLIFKQLRLTAPDNAIKWSTHTSVFNN